MFDLFSFRLTPALVDARAGFGELFPSGQSYKYSQIRSAWRRATAQSRWRDLRRPNTSVGSAADEERSSRRIHLQDAGHDAEQPPPQTWCPIISATAVCCGRCTTEMTATTFSVTQN